MPTLTDRQSAKILGTHTNAVRALIASGRIIAEKKAGRWSIDQSDLDKYIAEPKPTQPLPPITKSIKITDITVDAGTQSRVRCDLDTVGKYALDMQNGIKFPAITVFGHGAYYLGDGFHRHAAARSIGKRSILAEIHSGGSREATLHAVGANATHGLPRTRADIRKAADTILADPEWGAWSDRKIAKTIGVSAPFIATRRKTLNCNSLQPPSRKCADGRTINTTNIGKTPSPPTVSTDNPTDHPTFDREKAVDRLRYIILDATAGWDKAAQEPETLGGLLQATIALITEDIDISTALSLYAEI